MSNYKVELSERFKKDFRKLDVYTQKMIRAWINKNLVNTYNARIHGKALTGNLSGLWRYRIGDYRLIAKIKDSQLTILALSIGHRREIYR
ncbi:type II toxin-antitoxin system RelE/ParE family toxin [Anaerococcus sp. AGMB09787]|uniref:type II toxin-antitoxin system RelE family toxin n=1 Tax=Anaerococcus sp. AGMB09787 TaxID=2922869 RepID=UPI00325FDD17